MRSTLLIVAILFLPGLFHLPPAPTQADDFRNGRVSVRPLKDLPKAIVAPQGELTIFADYDNRDKRGVFIYMINRTGKDLKLSAQDGHVYLKLQVRTDDGRWVRAEPHAFSWCGNSYMFNQEINNNSFVITRGYVPKEGDPAEVRYHLYMQDIVATSNAGRGLVNKEDLRKATSDAFAVLTGDFEFVSKVATGKLALKNEMDHIEDLRDCAIDRLGDGEFDKKETAAVLNAIIEKNEAIYAQAAREALAKLLKVEKKAE